MGNKQQKNNKYKLNDTNPTEKGINNITNDNLNNNNTIYNIKNICKYYIKFVGSSGIGTKTSLIKRIKEGKFEGVTEENQKIYEKIIYEKDSKEFILYLMEDGTAINKISKIMPSSYADCIIMGYDLTNKQSFEDIKTYWIDKIKNRSNIDLIYLLGNKIDLKEKIEVDENEAKEFADKNNIKYFQISVKNDIKIQNFINDLKMNIETIDDNSPKLYGNPSKERYKVIFLGDSGVGAKTCLINRLVSNIYDDLTPSTNGASFATKFIKIKNGKEFLIDISGTAEQEKYRGLNKHFFTNTNCVILGYDCTRRESFENIKNFWLQYVNENAKVDLIYLIANKIDCIDDESVSEDEAKNYAKEKNMRFFPVFCKENIGIKEFWNDLCAECIKI